jgi:hypothetical protein
MSTAALLLIIILLAGPSVAWSLSGNHQRARVMFVSIGEGYTAPNWSARMRLEWRMFSAPDPTCEGVPMRIHLVTAKQNIKLRVGAAFSLDKLAVLAVDKSGEPVKPVPVMLEYEEVSPPILNLDGFKVRSGPIVPLRAGKFRFKVSVFRPIRRQKTDSREAAVIDVTVLPRLERGR